MKLIILKKKKKIRCKSNWVLIIIWFKIKLYKLVSHYNKAVILEIKYKWMKITYIILKTQI